MRVDATALIERNKKLYNEAPERWGDGAVAKMPMVLREKLKREGICDDRKPSAEWLNDPEQRAGASGLGGSDGRSRSPTTASCWRPAPTG